MPIEFECAGCGNTLRVPDEYAGRPAKCPECQQISQVPMVAEPATAAPLEPPAVYPDNPYASTEQSSATVLRSHRGGLILTLGLLSILCCNLLGIAALLMGNEDLAAMDRGEMDISGRGLTQAGKILGIIALVLMGVVIVLQVLFLAVGANV